MDESSTQKRTTQKQRRALSSYETCLKEVLRRLRSGNGGDDLDGMVGKLGRKVHDLGLDQIDIEKQLLAALVGNTSIRPHLLQEQTSRVRIALSESVEEARRNEAAANLRLRLFEFDNLTDIITDPTPSYLIKGLLPQVGTGLLYGAPKAGKSFMACDLAMHVALGWDYRGRRVRGGPTVYLTLEGQRGFRVRVHAFKHAKIPADVTDVPFYLCGTTLDLVKDVEGLVASIAKLLPGSSPALIVIDTVNRALVGSESSDQDMGAFLKAAAIISDEFETFVLLVHHCGVDASRPRGHTSLTGNTDVQISIKRSPQDLITAKLELAKDSPQGAEWHSRFRQVDVCLDDEGDMIRSLVIEEAQSVKPSVTAKVAKQSLAQPRKSTDVVMLRALIDRPDGSQRTWAEMAGCSAALVNRRLAELVNAGLVHRDGRRYIVTDQGQQALILKAA